MDLQKTEFPLPLPCDVAGCSSVHEQSPELQKHPLKWELEFISSMLSSLEQLGYYSCQPWKALRCHCVEKAAQVLNCEGE